MNILIHDPRVELPIRLLIIAIIILGLNYCNMTSPVDTHPVSEITTAQPVDITVLTQKKLPNEQ